MKTVIKNLKRIATKLEALETSRALSATAKISLQQLDSKEPIEHQLAAGAKRVSIVGRLVSINKKEGTVVVAKGKKRYTCHLPKGFSTKDLKPKDMLLIDGILQPHEDGILQPHEKDEEKVIKCKKCSHMAMKR